MVRKRFAIPALPDGAHKRAGGFDSGSRWYPNDEYDTQSMRRVRSPSRAWPYSYLHHFYTVTYSRGLLREHPTTWFRLAGIDPASPDGAQILAAVAAARMGVP